MPSDRRVESTAMPRCCSLPWRIWCEAGPRRKGGGIRRPEYEEPSSAEKERHHISRTAHERTQQRQISLAEPTSFGGGDGPSDYGFNTASRRRLAASSPGLRKLLRQQLLQRPGMPLRIRWLVRPRLRQPGPGRTSRNCRAIRSTRIVRRRPEQRRDPRLRHVGQYVAHFLRQWTRWPRRG